MSAKTQVSKEVNAVLESEKETFVSFERAKNAYDYFADHYPKIAKHVTYDNFHYYWTKKFKEQLEARKKGVMATPKASKPKTDEPVDLEELKQTEEVELVVFNPLVDEIDEDVFVPLKTGKPLDYIVSAGGGFYPGTTNVIFADGGVGKSTIAYDALYSIQKNHKKADCMALSSEMSRVDLHAEIKQGKAWMKHVKQILLDDYKGVQYKAVLTKVLLYGYDFLVIDSFQSILEKLQDKCYMNRNQAKNFMLDLIKQANDGKTETGKHTAIFLIQQVNKDGNFVGANSLKHDTTGMMVGKMDENGDRYFYYIKNRRNGGIEKKKMYFTLDENKEVVYDEERWNDDRDRELLMVKNKKNDEATKETFQKLFLKPKSESETVEIDDDADLNGNDDDDMPEF